MLVEMNEIALKKKVRWMNVGDWIVGTNMDTDFRINRL